MEEEKGVQELGAPPASPAFVFVAVARIAAQIAAVDSIVLALSDVDYISRP
jgi:hypothetical protein